MPLSVLFGLQKHSTTGASACPFLVSDFILQLTLISHRIALSKPRFIVHYQCDLHTAVCDIENSFISLPKQFLMKKQQTYQASAVFSMNRMNFPVLPPEHREHRACGDGGADDAGDVRSHGVHEEEVAGP